MSVLVVVVVVVMGTQDVGFAGARIGTQVVCKISVDGRSQVVLKVNNGVFKITSIVESISLTIIVTYSNLKFRE